MTPKELMKFVKDKDIKIIDFRFVDLPGLWQHFSMTSGELEEDMFEEGVGFDGSSIRGFQKIQESDMLLIPDASSAFVDPFTAVPTLDIICNVKDPVTLQPYSRDPRYISQKAEKYLKSTGIGDTAYFGPSLNSLSGRYSIRPVL
jgi:glutamine synthetase